MNLFKGSLLFCVSLVCAEEVIVDAPKIITKQWEERVFGIKQDARELPRAVHEMIDGILDDTFEKDFFERIHTAQIFSNCVLGFILIVFLDLFIILKI